MRPNNSLILDNESFNWMKRSFEITSKTSKERMKNPSYSTPLPQEIGLQLTYQCNLRCTHCFQWNDYGFFHNYSKGMQKQEIDLEPILNLLRATKEVKSRIYFWGGEPLVYSKWDELCEYMMDDPRSSIICTNGLLLKEKFDSITKLPIHPNLLISIDGLKESHDKIRGKGTFLKIIDNMMPYILLKQRKKFTGTININLVLTDDNVSELYDIAMLSENFGIDTLYLCFPWYIPENVAKDMDHYFSKNFSWLDPNFDENNSEASWHSYTHHISEESKNIFDEQIKKLNTKVWKTRVRFRPDLTLDESMDFLMGTDSPVENKKKCHAVSNRMDVLADGTVSSCKLFPEFRVGDLNSEDPIEIWRGEKYSKLREIMYQELTPICSKCVQLYLNGSHQ